MAKGSGERARQLNGPRHGAPPSPVERVVTRLTGRAVHSDLLTPVFLAGVAVFAALLILAIGLAERASYHLATRGAVADARVTATDYRARRASFEIVYVSGPAGATATVYRFDQRPKAGQRVQVRYDRRDPDAVISAGEPAWDPIPAIFGGLAVVMLLVSEVALGVQLLRLRPRHHPARDANGAGGIRVSAEPQPTAEEDRSTGRGPKHSAYSREERGSRVLWRTVTIALFSGLAWIALVLSDRFGWPGKLVLGLVAFPYWGLVKAIWSRYGPYMPGID